MPDDLHLIEPAESMRAAYLDYVEDFRQAGEKEIPGSGAALQADFSAFLRHLADSAKGVGLPAGWVPASTYWLVRAERVVGTCNLRHRLNEFLRDFGGHIGYGVRPSERRKGYGTLLLRLALVKARALGIDRVLVTCDQSNIASARVIQANGGVLDSETYSSQAGRVTQRYWIDVGGT